MFQLLIAVGDVGILGARVVEFRHAPRQRLHLFFDGMKIVEHGHALGKDGAAGEGEAILRKVSGRDAFGAGDGAVVERLEPGQDFHHRGLAGAVRSDQTDARLRRNQPVGVLEQELVAIALAGAGELDHVYLSKHNRRGSGSQWLALSIATQDGYTDQRPVMTPQNRENLLTRVHSAGRTVGKVWAAAALDPGQAVRIPGESRVGTQWS